MGLQGGEPGGRGLGVDGQGGRDGGGKGDGGGGGVGGGWGKGVEGCGLKIGVVAGEHGRGVVVAGETVVSFGPHGGRVDGSLVVVKGGVGGG